MPRGRTKRILERLEVAPHHLARDAHEQDLDALLAVVARRVVVVDLLARQRDQVLDLVLEHLGEVLARRGRQEHAVEGRLRARHAEHGAPRVDAALAGEGDHRVGERLAALRGLLGPRQRDGRRPAHRDPEEALGEMRQRHLVAADVDAEPVEEVGPSQPLRQLAEGHDAVLRNRAASAASPSRARDRATARAAARRGCPPRAPRRRPRVARLRGWEVSARASIMTVCAGSSMSFSCERGIDGGHPRLQLAARSRRRCPRAGRRDRRPRRPRCRGAPGAPAR